MTSVPEQKGKPRDEYAVYLVWCLAAAVALVVVSVLLARYPRLQ